MAKTTKTIPQNYPRVRDETRPEYGCLDDATLTPHKTKIPVEQMKSLIQSAINNAGRKSRREILSIPLDATSEQIAAIYEREGRELFRYFKRYCGDPAATAHQIYRKHYRDVGVEQFRNRTLQKERMNSGWRYQYLVIDCARQTKRFEAVSDIGAAEGDFTATIKFLDHSRQPLSLYVSVKNRSNTMGGADWPKAIQALETVAKNDKNRTGPYCCVFGIAMDRGLRYIKREQKTKIAHSVNTEIWLSDYFWPFFADHSYEEIMRFVLDVLVSSYSAENLPTQVDVPDSWILSGKPALKPDWLTSWAISTIPIDWWSFSARSNAREKMSKIILKKADVDCTVIHGDCRAELAAFAGQVDLIVTSPPYADARHKHYDGVHPDKFAEWFLGFHEPFYNALKPTGSLVLNIKDKVVDGVRHRFVWHTIEALCERGWFAIDDYLWHKTNPMPGYWPTRLRDGWEYCFHLAKSKRPYFNPDGVRKPIGDWVESRLNKLGQNDLARHNSVNESGFGRDISKWVGKQTVLPSNVLSIEAAEEDEFTPAENTPSNVISRALVGKNKGHPAVFPVELPAFFIRAGCKIKGAKEKTE